MGTATAKAAAATTGAAAGTWLSGGTLAAVAVGTFAVASIAFIGVGFAGDVQFEDDAMEIAEVTGDSDDAPAWDEEPVTETAPAVAGEDDCSDSASHSCDADESDPKLVIALPANLPKLPDPTPRNPAKVEPTDYERARRFADGTLRSFERAVTRVEKATSLQQAQAELQKMHQTMSTHGAAWKELESKLTADEKKRIEGFAMKRMQLIPSRITSAMARLRRVDHFTPKHGPVDRTGSYGRVLPAKPPIRVKRIHRVQPIRDVARDQQLPAQDLIY